MGVGAKNGISYTTINLESIFEGMDLGKSFESPDSVR